MKRPALFLIDAFGFIFRAYHARARSGGPPMRTSAGLPTEAIYIFNNMLRKLIGTYSPEYVAAVFESAGPTFREQEFAGYKANRPEAPPDLTEQIPYVRRLLEVMRIPILEYPGFEADDVIGAIAKNSAGQGLAAVIVSSDKDMLQLVDVRVSMYDPRKDTWYDQEKVIEFMGVRPAQVTDLLALKGDSIDNIPGAPGIGDKGARDLIQQFGSVGEVLRRAGEVKRKTYRESLETNRDQILMSKKLATIDISVPIEYKLDDLAAREADTAALRELYQRLEFFSLLKEMTGDEPGPGAPRDYRSLETEQQIRSYLESVRGEPLLAVAAATAGEGDLAQTVIGLAARPGEARSVPGQFIEVLGPVLEDQNRRKAALDVKAHTMQLARLGIDAKGFTDDPTLFTFLLTADPAACTPLAVIERQLGRKPDQGVEEWADSALQLALKLTPEVDANGLRTVYEKIDLPLAPVLARMETAGIRIEPAALRELSGRMESDIDRLTKEIHDLAGRPFNINSPQQLGQVLYEDLKLPAPTRYGKGKSRSTAADVLEGLAHVHPIAARILDYRQLVKLKGTYVDALPALIDPATGRLHTTFNQAGAATGRLSSSNPNLQNIPIRTELGREIRAAFVPERGWRLIVADYSQIELRLLAHMSKDPVLLDAFRQGEDIHTRTAAEVFGTPPLMVTPELRRNAKAVNFGIVYGLSPFGLSNQLGIPQREAEQYIRSYFERYQGVKRFIDGTIERVRDTGFTETLFGRRRPIPDINSRNPNARGFAERTAVNTPLQGTAADLIKLAMIRIDRELAGRRMQARMILQIHDELLFEAPPEEAEGLGELVKREMESVHSLEVPLVVDVGIGDNWRDAK